jgi:hypothetical protein
VLILWPRDGHEHIARPALLVRLYVEPTTLALPLIHRDLAFHTDASYLVNCEYIRRLVTTFRGTSVLLLIEIVFWVVDLIAKG